MLQLRVFPAWLGWLLLLFPVLEFFVFVQVAGRIGFFGALALVLATSAFGLHLLRGAGMSPARVRPDKLPELLMGQGFRLLAGILFFIPGFITDVLGLFCLLPVVRSWLARRGADVTAPQASRHEAFTDAPDTAHTRTDGRTVDGEFERLD